MNAKVFDEALSNFIRKVPFKPFTVTLVNGDRHEVDHPSAFSHRDGTAVFIAPGGIPVMFDHEGTTSFIGDLMAPQNGEN